MKKPVTTSVWDHPTPSTDFTAKHPEGDVDTWRKLITRVIDVAQTNSWTKAEVARRSDVKEGTFSQWASGKYPGILANINASVSMWLDALEEGASIAATVPKSPRFIKTSVGSDVYNTLLYTQITAGFTAVTLPTGTGKTHAAEHFRATRPFVWLATASPYTKSVHGMLVDLATALDVQEYNPARLVRAICRKLQRQGDGTLLIMDEAQSLTPDAINQLRHFVDIAKCGVALVGNEHTAQSFLADAGKSVNSRAQVASRFDRRLRKERDPVGDAEKLIAAWGIDDPACVRELLGYASKPGALRNIDRIMKGASMSALGDGDDIGLKHIRAAWRDRDFGDIQ